MSFLKKYQQSKEANKSPKDKQISLSSEKGTLTVAEDAIGKAAPETEKLTDLPLQPDKTWVNMDGIDKHKFKWTKTFLSLKEGDKSAGHPVRFNFMVRLKVYALLIELLLTHPLKCC